MAGNGVTALRRKGQRTTEAFLHTLFPFSRAHFPWIVRGRSPQLLITQYTCASGANMRAQTHTQLHLTSTC